MKPITAVEDAVKAVRSYEGKPDEFRLPVAEELLDPMGINMAIIGDSILARGWSPDGYIQEVGFRIYKFK